MQKNNGSYMRSVNKNCTTKNATEARMVGVSSSEPSFPYGPLNRLYGCCIVWLTQLIGDVLGVDDAVVPIKHKDRLLELPPFFEPHTIGLAELVTAMGREDLVQYAYRILPASLHLWRIH